MKNLVEKLPDQQPALRVMAMPPDTNQYGDVFGGWIMSQVDLAGSSIASRVANSRTATVAVTSFTFKEPVWVGDVVSFYATVLKVGTTSITVDVTVFAERLHKDNHRIVKVTWNSHGHVFQAPDQLQSEAHTNNCDVHDSD